MGSFSSKPVTSVEEEKVDGLARNMDRFSISEEKKGFIVEDDLDEGPAYVPSGISITRAEAWEDALLKDPKV